MAELNTQAKRLYNISPKPVHVTFEDGSMAAFQLGSVEFFQTELRGEGVRVDERGEVLYRFTTTEDNEEVIVGRQVEDGWELVGTVVEVEAVYDSDKLTDEEVEELLSDDGEGGVGPSSLGGSPPGNHPQ